MVFDLGKYFNKAFSKALVYFSKSLGSALHREIYFVSPSAFIIIGKLITQTMILYDFITKGVTVINVSILRFYNRIKLGLTK